MKTIRSPPTSLSAYSSRAISASRSPSASSRRRAGGSGLENRISTSTSTLPRVSSVTTAMITRITAALMSAAVSSGDICGINVGKGGGLRALQDPGDIRALQDPLHLQGIPGLAR